MSISTNSGVRHLIYTAWLMLETVLVILTLVTAILYLREHPLVWLPIVLLGMWGQRLYMVGHEASHRKLLPNSLKLNDLLGQLCLLPILVPMSVFRQIHFFHHAHNRRDVRTSALDVYLIGNKFELLQRCWSYTLWYVAVFGGGFFFHSLISILILLFLPPSIARRISPAFRGWTYRKQLQAIAIFATGIALHVMVAVFGGSELWLYCCGLPFLVFAWVYSALMYTPHYHTAIGKQVQSNARSMKRQAIPAWWLLNFNAHLVHHRNPAIPWYQLNRHAKTSEPKLNLLQAVLQQLRGPILIRKVG